MSRVGIDVFLSLCVRRRIFPKGTKKKRVSASERKEKRAKRSKPREVEANQRAKPIDRGDDVSKHHFLRRMRAERRSNALREEGFSEGETRPKPRVGEGKNRTILLKYTNSNGRVPSFRLLFFTPALYFYKVTLTLSVRVTKILHPRGARIVRESLVRVRLFFLRASGVVAERARVLFFFMSGFSFCFFLVGGAPPPLEFLKSFFFVCFLTRKKRERERKSGGRSASVVKKYEGERLF